ncbi:MAG: TetR/AcrR family transcriptional regulator [Alphaproteobacteria bacterium]|nr:TetR/AcrR family transcriptional regulator [Alphaproteobacteria bacterium]
MAKASAKRAAIIDAANEIFLRDGFEAASMEAVTARAGVSKATVYSHFPTKHALFAAIVHQRCALLVPTLEEATRAEAPPAEVLTAVGVALFEKLVTPAALDLYRVVVAEAPRQPELGRAFYEAGPDRLADALARYLAAQADAGRLSVDDPRLAAEQFLGMLVGHHHVRLLLGVRETPIEAAECRRLVAAAVARFIGAEAAPRRCAGAAEVPLRPM